MVVVAVLWSGCSVDPVRLGEMADGGGTFVPSPDAAADRDGSDAMSDVPMCIGTECPYPYTTCAASNKPVYKCGTDLSRDPDNCGECGNACVAYPPLNMKSMCIGGRCELECVNRNDFIVTDNRDCNNLVDDGCEVDVRISNENCGACGNVCPNGQTCRAGKCGCPPDKLECPLGAGTICVDPQTDDFNCNGCGNVCEPPRDACTQMPPQTKYGCVGGSCQMKCETRQFDCDGDIGTKGCASNGCEVGGLNDRENCGGCNIKCKPNEECMLINGDGPFCTVPCGDTGKTLCPDGKCVDLLSAIDSCGFCSNACPPAGPNQLRACHKGVCALECAEGFADCNADQSDGCETNLRAHPSHCGACGNECNIALGQPCVEGKCLMTACDDPGAAR
ncbi:MAG: Tryptophan synthase alpha chain [Labilithrix sp.]|nr:Tryptophan synthase alpha chain [Labilithrix sp.]